MLCPSCKRGFKEGVFTECPHCGFLLVEKKEEEKKTEETREETSSEEASASD